MMSSHTSSQTLRRICSRLTIGIALAALITLASPAAAGQATAPALAAGGVVQTVRLGTPEFARLVQGKEVTITTSDGTQQKGRVVALSATNLTLGGKQDTLVLFDQIVTVKEMKHRGSKFVGIGLGIGLGAGVAILAKTGGCHSGPGDEQCGLFMLMTVVPGVGIGASAGAITGDVVNARNRDRDVLYDAKRRTTTVMLTPILSPTRTGVAVSMTWR